MYCHHKAVFNDFGALQQFFFDGNKRTSRFMMNGILMSQGIDAISVPAAKAQEFNEKMVRFYLSKDATTAECSRNHGLDQTGSVRARGD